MDLGERVDSVDRRSFLKLGGAVLVSPYVGLDIEERVGRQDGLNVERENVLRKLVKTPLRSIETWVKF